MELSEEQQTIFNRLINFLEGEQYEILINSSAGTGKTFLITYFINYIIKNEKVKKIISVCTPTHTSLQELKSKLFYNYEFNEAEQNKISLSTIHRLLEYKQKITKDNEKYFSRNGKVKLNWLKYSLLIIDECSMLHDEICDDIFTQVSKYSKINNIKVIYIGDISQLNPVNQNVSKIFTKDIENLKMSKIIRTNNSKIMDICNSHKLWDLEGTVPNISEFVSKNVKIFNDKKKWLKRFSKIIKKTQNNIILCWTNEKKDYYNNFIRKKIFKKENLEKYEMNEILIFTDFHKITIIKDNEEKDVFFKSSQQFTIIDINVDIHKLKQLIPTKTKNLTDKLNEIIITNLENVNLILDQYIKIYKMKIKKNNIETNEFDDTIYEIYVIHEDSIMLFEEIKNKCLDIITELKIICYKSVNKIKNKTNNELSDYQNEIEIKIIKIWNKFNSIIDEIAKVNYAYAFTVHLSQSKTYNNVFIDVDNILLNQNNSEKIKLLYTALTRASTSLNLLFEI